METVLPPLRQELSLYSGPVRSNGSRSWILSDPTANRFFHISWPSLEILCRWHLGDIKEVVAAVNRETTLAITPEHVENIIHFVRANHLNQIRNEADSRQLLAVRRRSRQHWAKWLLHNYLFFRIPLFRPDRFLDFFKPVAAVAFTAWFWQLIGILAFIGGYLAFRQWESFISTFSAFGSWRQLACFSGAVIVCKIFHELGHAFAANRYGCRIGAMGIAFLVMFPMLYTDTTEAWKLSDKRKRLVIGASGILGELTLAVLSLLAWSFLPAGIMKSTAFFVATTAWVISLLMNASPFMRFDGYFVLSDLTGMANLHERSFAFGKWFMRNQLLGLDMPPPETVKPSARIWLLLFAYGTWVYRFFLFLSIALVVYTVFFKALGILLFAVEIGWFILLPVVREAKQWWRHRKMFRFNRRNAIGFILLGLFFFLLLIPWRKTVSAPAVWRAEQHREIYAPFPARVREIAVTAGQTVRKGDLLIRLEDPDLENRIHQARLQKEILQWQLDHHSFNTRLLDQRNVLEQRLAEAASRLKTGIEEAEKLSIAAPISGVVAEMNEAMRPGDWVADQEPLFFLITEDRSFVEAFVREEHLNRIKEKGSARFFPEDMEWEAMSCTLAQIDRVNISELEEPWLASVYGGEVAGRELTDGRFVPEYPLYRVRQENCVATGPFSQVVRGRAVFEAEAESILGQIFRKVAAVMIRESGF